MDRTALAARVGLYGYAYLDSGVVNDEIDAAVMEITECERWPWRYAVSSSATISDLGTVEAVTAGGRALAPAERGDLSDQFGDLDLATGGDAMFYWLEGSTLKFYPAAVPSNLEVVYYSRKAWTTGIDGAASGSDTPKIPARYHQGVIVPRVLLGFAAEGVRAAEVQMWEDRYQKGLEQMRRGVMGWQADESRYIQASGEAV